MGQLYKNPRKLTPKQLQYADKYMDKSGDDWEEYSTIPEEHEVFEWDDGFVDYTVYTYGEFDEDERRIIPDKTMFIHCIYSDGMNGYRKKFKDVIEVAEHKYQCNVIQFKTSRNSEVWKKMIADATNRKTKVVTMLMEIELNKQEDKK